MTFVENFETFDIERWQRGYWWQTNDQPFHPTEPREWFNPDNVRVLNSRLHLDLKLQPRTFGDLTIKHSAGVVCSKDWYGYGTYEARIRLPGTGNWCAFWLYGGQGDEPCEIDILEQLSGSLLNYHTDIHVTFPRCFRSDKRKHFPQRHEAAMFKDWHTYTVRWEPDRILFYFDGDLIRTHRTKAKYMKPPVRVIFNTARYNGADTTMMVEWFKFTPL